MWIMTTAGFYSIVINTRDKTGATVLVRARDKKDLENMLRAIDYVLVGRPKPEVIRTVNADYPFRMVVQRAAIARFLGDVALDIDYPNFKNAVGVRRGKKHALAFGKCWEALLKLEEPGVRE